jgi:hypothetical protein
MNDVIWETGHLKVSYYRAGLPQVKIERHNKIPVDLIEIEAGEFMGIAKNYLKLQGYDIIRREPELKPCPICGKEGKLAKVGYWWMTRCDECLEKEE